MIWVVDATDRLRMEDCRAELAGLLLEEVSIPKDSNTLTFATWDADCLCRRTASDGRQSSDLLKQNRYRGLHDRSRDLQGAYGSLEFDFR